MPGSYPSHVTNIRSCSSVRFKIRFGRRLSKRNKLGEPKLDFILKRVLMKKKLIDSERLEKSDDFAWE